MTVALAFSWQIGLIAIACIPFILGAGILQASCAGREPTRVEDGRTVSPATLLERLFHDVIVLQAYNLQDEVSKKYSAAFVPDVAFKKKHGMLSGLAFGFSQFAVFSTFALIIYAGIKLMAQGKVGFVDFFVALLAVMFCSFGAGQTGTDFSARKTGLEAGARLFEIVDESQDGGDPFSTKGDNLETICGKVKFKSIHLLIPHEAMLQYTTKETHGTVSHSTSLPMNLLHLLAGPDAANPQPCRSFFVSIVCLATRLD
jgi:ABC-type multidrug transport system fused ATPase/permease subunit